MIDSYRRATIIYIACFVVFAAWVWASGSVLTPVCHAKINGKQFMTPAMIACEHRKLADYEEEFLPEIVNQQTLPHSGFLVTRNELNEFGRQAKHITGNTPANIYTWVLFQLIKDPYQILTTQSLSLLCLFGLWVLLICRELTITPTAGLFAAFSGVSTPFLIYWLTFPMHIASVCWTAALLYAVMRIVRLRDVWGWVVMAFATYGLFLMGYPQTAVYSVWMLAGYVGVVSWPQLRRGAWWDVARQVGFMLSAVLFGVLMTIPAYLDLFVRFRDSSRFWVKDSFFLQAIQVNTSAKVAVLYGVSRFVPELFGNPIGSRYPLEFDGAGIPLLTGVLLIVVAIYRRSVAWWWLACVGGLWFLTISPTLFTVVLQLFPGFRVSAWTPSWSTVLPMVLVVAYGCDALLALPVATVRRILGWVICVQLLVVGCGFIVARWFDLPIAPWDGVRIGLVIATTIGLCWRVTPMKLWVALAITIAVTAAPLLVVQPRSAMIETTPLTQVLHRQVPQGARFAIVSVPLEYLLAPNYNAFLGVASVHSYNNFFTSYYQRLINKLGGKITVYGKLNRAIAPNYDDTVFWMSNIAVVLAVRPLDHPNVQLVTQFGDVLVYHVKQRMGQYWRIAVPRAPNASDIHIPDYHVPHHLPIFQYQNSGDVVELHYPVASTPSLVVFSTLFESGWQAESFDGTAWKKITPVSVNGSFLGVVVPAQSSALQVRYFTYVAYMWISHLIWFICFSAIGIWYWRKTVRTKNSTLQKMVVTNSA